MIDTEFYLAIFRPVHIREDPSDKVGRYDEEQRKRQKELLEDLQAEQCERM